MGGGQCGWLRIMGEDQEERGGKVCGRGGMSGDREEGKFIHGAVEVGVAVEVMGWSECGRKAGGVAVLEEVKQ